MFKRILVPLDGSGRAERALPIAARMARAGGGSIVLVRVVSTEPATLPSVPSKPNLIQTVGEADRMLAEGYLAGWASSDLLCGLSVQVQVPLGLIPPRIIAVATENHADIIVMCSHGYTGVKHWWMLGSVAAKIARFAQIPVMILREGGPVPEERNPGERPLRVLVPLDGSDYAKAALVPAAYLSAGLAAPGQGALHLTHVVEPAHEAKILTRTARATARSAQNALTAQTMAREYLNATMNSIRSEPTIAD